MTVLDTYKTVSIVACFRTLFDEDSNVLDLPSHHYQKGRDMIYVMINIYTWLGEPSSIMFRKKDIELVCKFDPHKYQFIDLDLWIRWLTIGDCYVIPEQLVNVRAHADKITRNNMNNYRFTFEDYELFKGLEEGNGYNIDVSDMNIDAAVKKKAVMCAKVIYKMLPKLHQSKSRTTLKKLWV